MKGLLMLLLFSLSLHHLFVFCQCAYYVDFSASRLVAVLAELGQKGGILRFIGKIALLWGGIRGAMSLTNRLISFLRISERPLFQRLVLCFYAQEKQLKRKRECNSRAFIRWIMLVVNKFSKKSWFI